jgi:hypothetical protein
MRRQSQFSIACCALVFSAASFLIALEVSANTAAQSLDGVAPAINRALKGDRMPLAAGIGRNAVNAPLQIQIPPVTRPQLPEGCEPVISAIGQSPLARIPGRCIS